MSEHDHIDHPHQSYHAMDDPRRHPPQPPWESRSGAARILMERHRQIYAEGYTPEHDRQHKADELLDAAWCYFHEAKVLSRGGRRFGVPQSWPWEPEGWKPSGNSVRNLEKAGALIAAAIDRIEADL